MKIAGLQKLTLLDYPGRLAADLFLPGCNFRCPFCQNSSLVLPDSITQDKASGISEEELFHFLRKRAGILDGICITGGEPTLHKELPELIRRIRALGYQIKLDTNGTNPDMLTALCNDGLLDFVSMDIKSGHRNYPKTAGLDGDCTHLMKKVETSVGFLLAGSIDYEFRTTVVKGLHTSEDFEDISRWIEGCRAYWLQSFRDCDSILLPDHSFSAYTEEEMHHFLRIVRKTIPQARLRGSETE